MAYCFGMPADQDDGDGGRGRVVRQRVDYEPPAVWRHVVGIRIEPDRRSRTYCEQRAGHTDVESILSGLQRDSHQLILWRNVKELGTVAGPTRPAAALRRDDSLRSSIGEPFVGAAVRGDDDRAGALEEQVIEVAALGRVEHVDGKVIEDQQVDRDRLPEVEFNESGGPNTRRLSFFFLEDPAGAPRD